MEKLSVTIPPELSLPITLINPQLDISPSQQVSVSNNKDETHEENTLRGIIMHQMLNHLSRSPKNELSLFYSAEINNIEKTKLESWWFECKNTITHENFSPYFTSTEVDQYFNEVPIQFKDNDEMVYGIIDRLIIKDKNITIIDYKTHPYVDKSNIVKVAKTYTQQMQLYKKGVQLLWPEYNVTTTLLFTSIASQYTF